VETDLREPAQPKLARAARDGSHKGGYLVCRRTVFHARPSLLWMACGWCIPLASRSSWAWWAT